MIFQFDNNFTQNLMQWLSGHGARILAILVAAVLIDAFLKSFVAKKSFGLPGIEKPLKEKMNGNQKQRLQTIINVLSGTLSFIVYVIAILMILPEFGVNIAPVLAGLGLVGLAIGMAARDILSDFITGFFILAEQQYNIGDRITVAGIEGTVKEVTLRRTVIEADDGTSHLIPNREIKIVARRKRAE